MSWTSAWAAVLLATSAATQAAEMPKAHPESVRWAEYYSAIYRVPIELVAAIIDEESGWNPYAMSRKCAAGIMQLMPATAVRFGVRNRFVVREPAQAQLGLLQAIQAVLNVINGVIQTALTSINTVRSAMNNLQQLVVWPQQLINQARAQVTQMIGQYRNLMSNIFQIKLNSATLPNPQALEAVIRDHQVGNFPALTAMFANNYGAIPVATAANPGDRAMSDMDDALALDNLKTLKAGDQATDIELQSADAIENSSGQAAPGSAPFLTATAITSSIHAQALTQKLLAAELRQEAARIAHRNTLRKENATNTTALRGVLVNLLQHQ